MVGCNNLLHSAHDGLHRVQDPVIVVEERRLLSLQAITVESIAPSKIVTGAAPNHQVKTTNPPDAWLEPLGSQALNIGDLYQSACLGLIPPSPQDEPVRLRYLHRNDCLHANVEPVESYLCSSNAREQGKDIHAMWKHVPKCWEMVCDGVDMEWIAQRLEPLRPADSPGVVFGETKQELHLIRL